MLNKEHLNKTISKLNEIIGRYESGIGSLPANELFEYSNGYDVKVLVIGAFNAGKSSLINRLIDRDAFLKEQQSPTTAVATEIHYSENEEYYGICANGSQHMLAKCDINNIEKYEYAQFYINEPAFKHFSDYTIVDTPGFDSNVEAHNAALAAYICKASAYLMVIDAEKGTIDASSLEFINEINQYTDNIAVLINKCDKMTKDNIEAVRCSVCDTLELAGFDLPVCCVSKFDVNLADKIYTILDNFGAQKMYERDMGRRISAAAQGMANSLMVLKQTANVNVYDYDVQIGKYDRAIRYIKETFEVKRAELLDNAVNYTNETIDEIRDELLGKMDALSQAALYRNETAMKSVIAETVRRVINVKFREFSVDELDNITRSLDFGNITSYEESRSLTEMVTSLAANTKDLINNGSFEVKETSEKIGKSQKSKDIFQKASGLLFIATDFIAPWLELCIVLLPEIVNIFIKIFGESDKAKLAKQIESVIIPQVTAELYSPVSEAVNQSCNELIAAAEQTLNAKIVSMKMLLEESETMKQQDVNNYNDLMRNIDKDMSVLIEITEGENMYEND